jgi:hypothetical protein
MKKGRYLFGMVALLASGIFALSACDSGEKAVDELTGNRAVKQYHKTTKDVGKIVDQQARKFQTIPEDEEDKGKKE